jgi:Mn2+/Fe2+ NRAMP family transporter
MHQSLVSTKRIFKLLGPGILYAAAAVGISHLVQATRAGAEYALGLTLIVVLACIIKYPSLRFGGDYAAVTGKSLISNYRQQGPWAFYIYAIAQLFSMVFIIAAISLFTLGLLKASLGISINNLLGIALLLGLVVFLLIGGHYKLLEQATKVIVAVFTVLIIIAVALVAVKMEWSLGAFAVPDINGATLMFIIALIGFMPSPADGSVLQSLWVVARADQDGQKPSLSDTRLDFNIGYLTSVMLAVGFLILGAGVMHSSAVEVAKSNGGFAEQLLQLFTLTIGSWSFPFIAVAAFFVMFSTLYTVVDGMTRIVIAIGKESFPDWLDNPDTSPDNSNLYNTVILLLCLAALLILATLLKSFATFMDMTSILVFVVSPLIAWLNHRAIWGAQIPIEMRPGTGMRIWSIAGIAVLGLLTITYFYVRFLAN